MFENLDIGFQNSNSLQIHRVRFSDICIRTNNKAGKNQIIRAFRRAVDDAIIDLDAMSSLNVNFMQRQ